MNKTLRCAPLLAVLLLGACATIPNGPGVMALPGTGKSFDEFRANDAECRSDRKRRCAPLLAVLLLGACATIPNGPGVMALPGTGKSFDEFRANDAECR